MSNAISTFEELRLGSDRLSPDDVIDEVGTSLQNYWEHKKSICKGSESDLIKIIIDSLAHICIGASCAGAGKAYY